MVTSDRNFYYFLMLGYALIQIPSMIVSIYDYLKDGNFLTKESNRVQPKVTNLSAVEEQVKKHSNASIHGNTESPETTYRIQEQNFPMNVENRLRSLEVAICHLTTIVEGRNNGEK